MMNVQTGGVRWQTPSQSWHKGGNMKKILVVLMILAFALTGCKTFVSEISLKKQNADGTIYESDLGISQKPKSK